MVRSTALRPPRPLGPRQGKARESQFRQTAVRNQRFRFVNNSELFDLAEDPGERRNVIEDFPEIVAEFRHAHDGWWQKVQAGLVNEDVVGPRVNPYKARFWRQQGGGPHAALAARMDPFSPEARAAFPGLVPGGRTTDRRLMPDDR